MLRVLVVDDCADSADSLATLLRLWGFEARAAHGGEQALAAAAAFLPEAVLLDLVMPRLDGFAVARLLRAAGGLGDALVLATTGCDGPAERLRAAGAGFDAFLVKPIDLDRLRRILDNRVLVRGPAAAGPAVAGC